jgi:hypothetical protein
LELERDGAFELGVFGLVQNTHSSTAKLLEDFVM